jgi:hypothetical protein
MSRINPRLFFWLVAVHDHPALSPAHRDILAFMALKKLDYGTGRGYCSIPALAEGRGWHPATVKRALQLARTKEPKLLQQTRRGHRLNDEQTIASEWALIYPPVPVDNSIPRVHQNDLGTNPRVQRSHPKGAEVASQGRTPAPPSGIESSSGSEATSELRRALTLLRPIDPETTSAEAQAVLNELASRPAVQNPAKVLGAEIRDGNGQALIERARHSIRKADMAQLDGDRDGYGDPDRVASTVNETAKLLAEIRSKSKGISNSLLIEHWDMILGWANGEPIAIAVGNAAELRELAGFMDLIQQLRNLDSGIGHHGTYGDHDGPARQPGDASETQ